MLEMIEGLEAESKIRLGVSACLMGEMVRFDGGHKRDRFLLQTLGEYVQWIPVCPEVEIGLGTPRESLRLVGNPSSPRLVAPRSGADHTAAMQSWAGDRLAQLKAYDLDGFVLKRGSPSCGLFRVRVYDSNNIPSRAGRGIFAKELIEALPLLPVEEEGRLHDPRLRENFLDRVFSYKRWSEMLEGGRSPASLVDFHARHKLSFMAHSPAHYQAMGQLAARAGTEPWDELTSAYGKQMMDGLQVRTSPGKHTNVLQHILGFLKNDLPPDDKAEVHQLVEDYRKELVPLIVPLTLISYFVRKHPTPEWLRRQVYLNPYPKELALRNHV